MNVSATRLIAMTEEQLPTYLRLARELKDDIAEGRIKPGEKLPSLSELAKRFGVGMSSVRRAVDELVQEHILHTHQGKGVFVHSYSLSSYWNRFHRFQRPDGSLIQQYEDRLTYFEVVPATDFIAEQLDLEPGEFVIHWQRVMGFDGQKAGFDEAYLPRKIFRNLSPEHFSERPKEKSIYAIYEDTDNVVIAHSSDSLSARLLSEMDAAQLELPAGIPMFHIERTCWDIKRRKVEYRLEYTDARRLRIKIGE